MNQRLWFSEEPCYGHDPEIGVSPSKKRRKNPIKRGQASLFLALVGFAVYCLHMVHVSSTDTDVQRWAAGFIFSALLALFVFFYDNRRRHRRGRYGTYD